MNPMLAWLKFWSQNTLAWLLVEWGCSQIWDFPDLSKTGRHAYFTEHWQHWHLSCQYERPPLTSTDQKSRLVEIVVFFFFGPSFCSSIKSQYFPGTKCNSCETLCIVQQIATWRSDWTNGRGRCLLGCVCAGMLNNQTRTWRSHANSHLGCACFTLWCVTFRMSPSNLLEPPTTKKSASVESPADFATHKRCIVT